MPVLKLSSTPFLSVSVRDNSFGKSVYSIEPRVVIVSKKFYGSVEISIDYKLTDGLISFTKDLLSGSAGLVLVNDIKGVPIWAYEVLSIRRAEIAFGRDVRISLTLEGAPVEATDNLLKNADALYFTNLGYLVYPEVETNLGEFYPDQGRVTLDYSKSLIEGIESVFLTKNMLRADYEFEGYANAFNWKDLDFAEFTLRFGSDLQILLQGDMSLEWQAEDFRARLTVRGRGRFEVL